MLDPLDMLCFVLFNAALYTLIGIAVERNRIGEVVNLTMGGNNDRVWFSGPRPSYAHLCALRHESGCEVCNPNLEGDDEQPEGARAASAARRRS